MSGKTSRRRTTKTPSAQDLAEELDRKLTEALMLTFPASDPIAVGTAGRNAAVSEQTRAKDDIGPKQERKPPRARSVRQKRSTR